MKIQKEQKNVCEGHHKKIETIFLFRNNFKYHSYEHTDRFSLDNMTKHHKLAKFRPWAPILYQNGAHEA